MITRKAHPRFCVFEENEKSYEAEFYRLTQGVRIVSGPADGGFLCQNDYLAQVLPIISPKRQL